MLRYRSRLKYLIVLTIIYSTAMMWHWKIGFTYFTQLSNLYVGCVVLLQLVIRRPLAMLKYTSVVSITVTFLVYLLVLAPMTSAGFLAAYAQDHFASLFLHLVTPLLANVDFIINDAPMRRWQKRDALWAALPPLIWLGMILLLGMNGIRWYAGMAAPYGFLNYGSPVGWLGWKPETFGPTSPGIGVFYIILILTLIFFGIGLMFVRICQYRVKKQPRD